MTTAKPTFNYLYGFLGVAAFGIGIAIVAGMFEENRRAALAVEKNTYRVEKCIEAKGNAESCSRVDLTMLSDERAEEVKPFVETWNTKQAEAEREYQERRKAAAEQRKAEAAEREAEAAEAAAKFKAEGWWEEQPGIFVRWCDGTHLPCPRTSSVSDYVWRAMVWCKERACGDIYARLNILQNDVVVDWTNDSAYGGQGQKVVLTFGAYTQGQGQLVEFSARQ